MQDLGFDQNMPGLTAGFMIPAAVYTDTKIRECTYSIYTIVMSRKLGTTPSGPKYCHTVLCDSFLLQPK